MKRWYSILVFLCAVLLLVFVVIHHKRTQEMQKIASAAAVELNGQDQRDRQDKETDSVASSGAGMSPSRNFGEYMQQTDPHNDDTDGDATPTILWEDFDDGSGVGTCNMAAICHWNGGDSQATKSSLSCLIGRLLSSSSLTLFGMRWRYRRTQ